MFLNYTRLDKEGGSFDSLNGMDSIELVVLLQFLG